MIINRNMAAINILSKINSNANSSAKSMERISSGMRINRAADDAAGTAISEKMRSQIRGLEQAQKNIQDGISFIQTAESGLAKIADPNLHRLRQLAVQAGNDTLSSGDRQAIQNEVNQILGNIDDIADDTKYNGISLLNVPAAFQEPQANQPSNKSDIVFIIDKTGSMGDDIAMVAANIQDFATALNSKGINIQLGLVTYGDVVPSEGGDPIRLLPLTTDIDKFEQSIKAIQVGGGGGGYMGAESGLEGINEAMEYAFRSDASKQFVLITDAKVHDDNTDLDGGDGQSLFDIEDMAARVKNQDIKLTVVGPADGNVDVQLQRLSEPTGGAYLNIRGDFSSQLKVLANEIVNDSSSENADLQIQIGANAGEVYGINLSDARTESLGINQLKVDPWSEAQKAISKLDGAMQQVSSERAKYGAYENSLGHLQNSAAVSAENLTAAESRIRDTDMAKEIMNLTKANILNQASQAMMAQANKQPQSILELLK
ncbi:flagellin [Planomicrobium koreense]|uniref:Flagellin n=1 Tax=Planococcus koreensis TaxID=112331 RepID=A0A7W8CSD3_9BACL|nr:flagellin [Planococcus koreensis]MBB5179327.1 flagellin [Planococcus koreensis]